MTFAITTKSGRSVNIKAENYKEAQKYADRHFGKGCIVQLVGNAARNAQPWLVPGDRVKYKEAYSLDGWAMATVVDDLGHVNGHRVIRLKLDKTGKTEDVWWGEGSLIVPIRGQCRFYKNSISSTNPTVANALAAKAEVAANEAAEIKGDGKPTDGSYLLARPYYEIFRDGRMLYACRAWEDVKHLIKKGYRYRVVNSGVADALACNAGRKTVKVELETVSFEKGVRSETRYMSVEEVRDLLKRLGQSGDADSFISRLERQGASDIAINEPDLYAALI